MCKRMCEAYQEVCKSCKAGCYCSSACRESHQGEHKEICGNIQELEKIEAAKREMSAFSVREANQVRAKLKDGLVRLVGERPLVHCELGGADSYALWDTGAMVSLVSRSWLEQKRPGTEIMTIEEFLEGDSLHLCAANNTNVDVEGVAILKFQIGSSGEVSVPFLVVWENYFGSN